MPDKFIVSKNYNKSRFDKWFKEEIIKSDLLANLKNYFGEDIDEDKIIVIDHEE